MNILVLDENPQECAKMHCDKHVLKMCIEYAQLLSTTYYCLGLHKYWMYKPTHIQHPCAKWARASVGNARWLTHLGYCLAKEYQFRYNKEHATNQLYHKFTNALAWLAGLPEPMTDFELCMPDKYKYYYTYTECYQAYYIGEKSHFLNYTKREKPLWLKNL